jgi:hypothetical protein
LGLQGGKSVRHADGKLATTFGAAGTPSIRSVFVLEHAGQAASSSCFTSASKLVSHSVQT